LVLWGKLYAKQFFYFSKINIYIIIDITIVLIILKFFNKHHFKNVLLIILATKKYLKKKILQLTISLN